MHPTDKLSRMYSLYVNYNTIFLSVLQQSYSCGLIDSYSLSRKLFKIRTCEKIEGRKIEGNREEEKTEMLKG